MLEEGKIYTWLIFQQSTYAAGLGRSAAVYPHGSDYKSGNTYYWMFRTYIEAIVTEPTLTATNGFVGIRNHTPAIHLAIGDSDTGLHQHGDGELAIHTNGGERLRVDAVGNVGIKRSPDADVTLTVHGSTRIYGGDNTYNTLYTAGGNFTIQKSDNNYMVFVNNDWAYTSDLRLKENIHQLPNVLDQVMALNPVRYNRKTDEPDTPQETGFIAQEVQEVFPEFVVDADPENGDPNLKLTYGRFGVVAIKAIQEQQEIIDQQASQIALLMKRLEALENSTNLHN